MNSGLLAATKLKTGSDEWWPCLKNMGTQKRSSELRGGGPPAFHSLYIIINTHCHIKQKRDLCWIDTFLGPHTDLLVNDKSIRLAKQTGC